MRSRVENMSDTGERWDSLAHYWNDLQNENGDWYHQYILYPSYLAIIDKNVNGHKNREGLSILDIGCGTGVFTRMLCRYCTSIVGIDMSGAMLEYAARRKKSMEKYYKIDCQDMKIFANSSFHIAICDLTIQSITNPDKFLAEVSRILKLNGTFIFSIEHPFSSLFPYTHLSTKRSWLDAPESHDRIRHEEKYLMRMKERILWNDDLCTPRYCRTLEDYCLALNRNGIIIKNLLEPLPLPEGKNADASKYEISTKFPKFLIFETIKIRGGINVKEKKVKEDAWKILSLSSSVCKSLVWLRDTDSCLPLVPNLVKPLSEALYTISEYPNAIDLLCDKMISNYRRAIKNNWVGTGAQPKSTRLGNRASKIGLNRAREYANKSLSNFLTNVEYVRRSRSWMGAKKDWNLTFNLAEQFIDYLDWNDFVTNNPRGQVSNLVLEAVELVEAVERKNKEEIQKEIGDVFYNLIASCLSLNIDSDAIIKESYVATILQSTRRQKH